MDGSLNISPELALQRESSGLFIFNKGWNMQIRKNLAALGKYQKKCPYPMKPTRVVVHNTANDAPALNEVKYMLSNNSEVSFHYAVDDLEAVQAVPENRNTWNAGDGNGKGNREGISVEICYSKSGGTRFLRAEQNAAELIASILERYGWGIDKVTKHQDYSGKYCPHRTLDMGWQRFLDMVESCLTPLTLDTKSKDMKPGELYQVLARTKAEPSVEVVGSDIIQVYPPREDPRGYKIDVVAKKPGFAHITVKAGGISCQCNFNVEG